MAAKSKTAPSTPRLSEFARSFVYPSGIVRTVWTRVEAKGAELGFDFDWWQRQLGMVCLGYGEDGKYVATVGGIGMSIPRQVGKTFFVLVVLVIMCILFPGLQVVWTAHHLRTSTKTFTTLRGICRRKKVAPHILPGGIRSANGEQQVAFVNGSMIMFGARSMGFGRGFDEIDVEVFDESQILDTKALEDMIAATNQARHVHGALLFFMGTPPRKTDPSEAFSGRRAKALAGKAPNAVWLEIGADPTTDPDDRSVWPLMNPSFPTRTPLESMLRLRENLQDDESWNREGRGIWDSVVASGVLPFDAWLDDADELSIPVDDLALGIEVAPDGTGASVALAGVRADGSWHIELDERRDGSAWVVPHVQRLLDANPKIRAVVADAGSPSKALLDDFKTAGVKITTPTVRELGAAHLRVLSSVKDGTLHHIAQPQLSAAAKIATKRNLGDTGMWVFHRASAASDITPIQAATLALHGAQNSNVRPPKRRSGRLVTVG